MPACAMQQARAGAGGADRLHPPHEDQCRTWLTLHAIQALQLILKSLPRVAGQAAQTAADGLAKVAGGVSGGGRGDRKVVLRLGGRVICQANDNICDLSVEDLAGTACSDGRCKQKDQRDCPHGSQLGAPRCDDRLVLKSIKVWRPKKCSGRLRATRWAETSKILSSGLTKDKQAPSRERERGKLVYRDGMPNEPQRS